MTTASNQTAAGSRNSSEGQCLYHGPEVLRAGAGAGAPTSPGVTSRTAIVRPPCGAGERLCYSRSPAPPRCLLRPGAGPERAYLPHALAASFCICGSRVWASWVVGFLTKSSMSAHICFSHAPLAVFCRSSRLNTKLDAFTSSLASARVIASGYELSGTVLFGEVKPPMCAQISPGLAVAMYLMSALAWGVLLSSMPTSPAPCSALAFAESAAGAGKGKKL